MAVVLVCLGGIAGCSALVFAVETLVAFGLHRKEPTSLTIPALTRIDERVSRRMPLPSDKAA